MDDPIFDPWADPLEGEASDVSRPRMGESPASPSADAPRWRSQHATPGWLDARPGARRPDTDGLSDSGEVLRRIVMPALEETASRLRVAHHRAVLEDRVEDARPTARLTVQPWRGPWTASLSSSSGVLEFELVREPEAAVIVRSWTEGAPRVPAEVARAAPARVSAVWLRRVIVAFVAGQLGTA